jgi:hypothetical protein
VIQPSPCIDFETKIKIVSFLNTWSFTCAVLPRRWQLVVQTKALQKHKSDPKIRNCYWKSPELYAFITNINSETGFRPQPCRLNCRGGCIIIGSSSHQRRGNVKMSQRDAVLIAKWYVGICTALQAFPYHTWPPLSSIFAVPQ